MPLDESLEPGGWSLEGVEAIAQVVVDSNPRPVADYLAGNNTAFQFLFGGVLRLLPHGPTKSREEREAEYWALRNGTATELAKSIDERNRVITAALEKALQNRKEEPMA